MRNSRAMSSIPGYRGRPRPLGYAEERTRYFREMRLGLSPAREAAEWYSERTRGDVLLRARAFNGPEARLLKVASTLEDISRLLWALGEEVYRTHQAITMARYRTPRHGH